MPAVAGSFPNCWSLLEAENQAWTTRLRPGVYVGCEHFKTLWGRLAKVARVAPGRRVLGVARRPEHGGRPARQ